MIPAAIQKQAASLPGTVGRATDSAGKHVAYWYAPPDCPQWRIYRHSVNGMVAMLRQIKHD